MSRTLNTEPHRIRKYHEKGKSAPKRINATRAYNRPDSWKHKDAWLEWEDIARNIDPLFDEEDKYLMYYIYSHCAPDFRRDLNKSYRHKEHQKVREGKYDQTEKPRRNAAWLYW